ncbi:MAG: MFS transporter [Caldilineaceae bacterium]|nr:MFS transporter [Caldilineaceae bacterium]
MESTPIAILRRIGLRRRNGIEDEPVPAAHHALPSQQAWMILYALMIPSTIMPLSSSMSRVALPVLRDAFTMSADVVAWTSSAFTLPYMILMPVYGRLSDGVGRRRLILAGIAIFSAGSAMAFFATNLTWLMIGRAVQGFGIAGIMPLGMAFIATIFREGERGKALGTWGSIGPLTAAIGPFFAGFLVDAWGWRAAFGPAVILGLLGLLAVKLWVPAGLSNVRPRFWRTFDWPGVLLLAGALTMGLFYLSSRPITGVAPLQDWRLFGALLLCFAAFLVWEKRRPDPFVNLNLFRYRNFSSASLCASMRMLVMGGSSFLIPLYLVDIHNLSPGYLGLILTINPGAMTVMVRFGGLAADRWGSRWPVLVGLSGQALAVFFFSQLPADAHIGFVLALLALQGLSVGTMLAALHQAAMSETDAEEMGTAAGVYSMIRFIGVAIGTALAGVLLYNALERGLPAIEAYQQVFLIVALAGLVGITTSLGLRTRKPAGSDA